MAKIKAEMSMLEAAEMLIKRKIKPQKFSKIAKEVFELMGIALDDEDKDARIAQLYTDLSLSGKFVVLGDDMWDLKARQSFDTADYDTYELGFDTEEVATPLLGDDAPAGVAPISAILDEDDDDDDDAEEVEKGADEPSDEEEVTVADDYGDDSDAEVKEKEADEHAGLSIYKEEELD
ncbi:MAG: DNA-directed RNA polymerase subunit delta [Turicibacter sp.]|nr:DNA-directed RNA polymerase subunit delta [Turicibacter sp.]